MGIESEDREIKRLAAEIAELTGRTETVAVREALEAHKARLELTGGDRAKRRKDLQRFMETEIWPQIPDEIRGKTITKAEREEILGYGPEGY
jgi:antitoxin VapB